MDTIKLQIRKQKIWFMKNGYINFKEGYKVEGGTKTSIGKKQKLTKILGEDNYQMFKEKWLYFGNELCETYLDKIYFKTGNLNLISKITGTV